MTKRQAQNVGRALCAEGNNYWLQETRGGWRVVIACADTAGTYLVLSQGSLSVDYSQQRPTPEHLCGDEFFHWWTHGEDIDEEADDA